MRRLWIWLSQEVRNEGAYLLPLRFFIGLGWLRAAAEKVWDADWLTGAPLTTFLTTHLAAGQVVFPWYRSLIQTLFLPHVTVLSWVVLLGQIACGAAIMLGWQSKAALAGGMFMNLNFLLAGVPDPSAFYLVIQAALLVAGAGNLASVDSYLKQRIISRNMRPSPSLWADGRMSLLGTLIGLSICIYASTYVQTLEPGPSVKDPALILVVLSGVGMLFGAIGYLRTRLPSPTVQLDTPVVTDAVVVA